MNPPMNSQVDPLPENLPFRVVSKTIGSGAYASIRKATPLDASSPIVAVKFINKKHALRVGHLSDRQIRLEISLHVLVCNGKAPSPQHHDNIIKIFHYGEDESWVYLVLELADGGDLFDKIEADEGVPQDVAHFYFRQLISAVAWCHGKGVAHRDIKPENMLLDAQGALKLADFGLAALFRMENGEKKLSATVCGSPPYIAPEIVKVGVANQARRKDSNIRAIGYAPDMTDIWSCGIVLFVLLVGNTPWDTPIADGSPEFAEFLATDGRPNDELWDNLPMEALSLIRGMLKVIVTERFSLLEITTHPWYLSPNKYINSKGQPVDSVSLATTMMERLHIDMSQPTSSTPPLQRTATITQKDYESQDWHQAFPNTQPETPAADDAVFDWKPITSDRLLLSHSASQPTTAMDRTNALAFTDAAQHLLDSDISMSQYNNNSQKLPLTLTQAARKFGDIAPSHSLTRFYSIVALPQLIDTLIAALVQLGVPAAVRRQEGNLNAGGEEGEGEEGQRAKVNIWIKGLDQRRQPLYGDVFVEALGRGMGGLVEVRFLKAKGDPVEWRRLFKKVVGLVRHVVFVPDYGGEQDGMMMMGGNVF